MINDSFNIYDVFLSHPHTEADAVEKIAMWLEKNANVRVWMDRWRLVPGKHWQQDMVKGLDEAKTCAVFLGNNTPSGWFQEEIESALNKQTHNPDFRVIPVILPNGNPELINTFLRLRTWVEFKDGIQDAYALHLLECGIKGIPPNSRLHNIVKSDNEYELLRENLRKIRDLRNEKLIDDEIAIEHQRLLLDGFVKQGKI